MEVQFTWASIGVIIAVLSHGVFTVWSAATFKATISTKLDNLVNAMQKMDKELEKRDTQISAVWKRVDELNARVTFVEVKQK